MARLRVLVASAALGVSMLAASPALAQEGTYPPSAPAGSEVQADGSVTIDVCCFTPGETVVVFDADGNVIFTGVAGSDGRLRGRVRASVIASLGDSGVVTLVAVGQASGRRSFIQVDLGAAAAERASGPALTRTGASSTIPLAASGVALTMVGAAMVLVWRRPRSAPAAA